MSRGPLALGAAALTLALGAVTTPAATASQLSDAADGGLWYYSATGVADAHDTATGEGVTIAVIDGPVNPDAPDLAGADVRVMDSFCLSPDGDSATSTGPEARHATTIAELLVGTGAGVDGRPGVQGVAPGATLLTYSVNPPGYDYEAGGERPPCYDEDGEVTNAAFARSVDDAVANGADIISVSLSWLWTEDVEGRAIADAYAAGVVVVGAADNDGGTFMGYPAHGNGVVAVEMADPELRLDPDDRTTSSPFLTVVAPGAEILAPDVGDGSWDAYRIAAGTSYATPWVAGVLALAWSQHPEATGNQMIHALINNTTVDNPDLEHDPQWGFGPVSVPKLMAADPTGYPDENPLLRPLDMDPASEPIPSVPTTAQVLEAAGAAGPDADPTSEPEASPTTEPSSTPDADADGTATDGTPVALLVVGAVVLLALLTTTALLLRRRSRKDT